jgi:hypothetical protein
VKGDDTVDYKKLLALNGERSSNILFWQPVTLKADTKYIINGSFIDLTEGELDCFWCEILIGTMEPEDSVDYPDGDWSVLGFNTWLGCGANNVLPGYLYLILQSQNYRIYPVQFQYRTKVILLIQAF